MTQLPWSAPGPPAARARGADDHSSNTTRSCSFSVSAAGFGSGTDLEAVKYLPAERRCPCSTASDAPSPGSTCAGGSFWRPCCRCCSRQAANSTAAGPFIYFHVGPVSNARMALARSAATTPIARTVFPAWMAAAWTRALLGAVGVAWAIRAASAATIRTVRVSRSVRRMPARAPATPAFRPAGKMDRAAARTRCHAVRV